MERSLTDGLSPALVVGPTDHEAHSLARAVTRAGFDPLVTVGATDGLDHIAGGRRFSLVVCHCCPPAVVGREFHERASSAWSNVDSVLVFVGDIRNVVQLGNVAVPFFAAPLDDTFDAFLRLRHAQITQSRSHH